ncbi:MAG TPA: ABC transporter permease [Clostridiales bacterium]|nr:ABC transporter permease [Clostridiales bacterium]
MFFNTYKYNLKVLLKEKMTVFWIILYPIILATIYYFCFTNLLDGESFEKINIAIVENENMPSNLLTAIDESEMFNVNLTNLDEAKDMLSTAKIAAYINYNNDIELIVNKEGMNESITKVFLDNYSQITNTIKNVINKNPEVLQNGYLESIDVTASHVKDIPVGNSTNLIVIFYYSMLAMTCLMSATLGSDSVTRIQANQSNIAARVNVAPTHKLRSFMSLIASSMTFHMVSVLLTLFYIDMILGVEFGEAKGYILLICFVGSFMGMSFGSFISAIIKKKEGVKMAIILTVILFGCFLAGMMNVDMKYIMQSNFPIVSYINPSNLITDGLYTLYYYDTLTRYFINLGILGAYGVLFSILTYLILRRQKYASI